MAQMPGPQKSFCFCFLFGKTDLILWWTFREDMQIIIGHEFVMMYFFFNDKVGRHLFETGKTQMTTDQLNL